MASLNDIEIKTQNIRDKLDCRVVRSITGAMPITFRSNGAALIDYHIYGTAEGAGERTENLLPSAVAGTRELNGITATCDGKGKYTFTGTAIKDASFYFSIPEFSLPLSKDSGGGGIIAFFNNNSYSDAITFTLYSGNQLSHYWALSTVNRVVQTWTPTSLDQHLDKIGFVILSGVAINLTIEPVVVDNSTEPTTHIPYGYQIPLIVSKQGQPDKTADIYIGDTKLLNTDYIDYEIGKIVRNGTPQEPPLSLPEIGTYIGINTLDSAETLGEVTIKGKIKEVI